MDNEDRCLCAPGFYPNQDGSDGCSVCPAYKYKDIFSNAECQYCPANHYFTQLDLACGHCELNEEGSNAKHRQAYNPDGYSWAQDQAACRCNLGYRRDPASDTCVECAAGTYQASLDILTCNDCDLGTYQDTTASSACNNCGSGQSSTLDYTQFTENTASTSVDQCICPNGFQRDITDKTICTACVAGKFRDKSLPHFSDHDEPCKDCDSGFYQDDVGQDECKSCPGLSDQIQSNSPFNSLYDCDCPDHFAFSSDVADHPQGCIRCSPNFYPGVNEGVQTVNEIDKNYDQCTQCPNGRQTTLNPPIQKENCLAPPGYTHVDDGSYDVRLCDDGYYKTDISNDPCDPCSSGPGAISEEPRTSFENCGCDATEGYYDPR